MSWPFWRDLKTIIINVGTRIKSNFNTMASRLKNTRYTVYTTNSLGEFSRYRDPGTSLTRTLLLVECLTRLILS